MITQIGKDQAEPGTGYLVIAHGAIAEEMLNALSFITGPQPNFRALALDHNLDVDRARGIVMSSIDEIMSGKGVIVLTDLFGGAPSNIALSMLDDRRIEIVAGMNLPMLIHAVSMDENLSLKEKATRLYEYGRNNIFIASDILSARKKSAGG